MADTYRNRQAQIQEQLLREEEAQKRRITLRRQQAEKLKGEARRKRIVRNSYLAILWFAVICGLSIGIAYVWPMFRKFVLE